MKYETKTLPSGMVIQNRPNGYYKCVWYIKDTFITYNEDEPALEYSNGDKSWYQYDKCHRLDGPAIERANGNKYYINGVLYKEEDYWNHPEVLKFKYLKDNPELEAFV